MRKPPVTRRSMAAMPPRVVEHVTRTPPRCRHTPPTSPPILSTVAMPRVMSRQRWEELRRAGARTTTATPGTAEGVEPLAICARCTVRIGPGFAHREIFVLPTHAPGTPDQLICAVCARDDLGLGNGYCLVSEPEIAHVTTRQLEHALVHKTQELWLQLASLIQHFQRVVAAATAEEAQAAWQRVLRRTSPRVRTITDLPHSTELLAAS